MVNLLNLSRSLFYKIVARFDKYTITTFLKYVAIGFTGLSLDLTIFVLLNSLSVSPYISNVVSMLVSINNNFFLNAFYNFKLKDGLLGRWIQFNTIGVGGVLLSNFLLHLLMEYLLLGENISKIITIPFIAVMQYLLHRIFTFRRRLAK